MGARLVPIAVLSPLSPLEVNFCHRALGHHIYVCKSRKYGLQRTRFNPVVFVLNSALLSGNNPRSVSEDRRGGWRYSQNLSVNMERCVFTT